MAYADSKGFVRQNFECNSSISEHLGVAENCSSFEVSVVPRSPAEELIFASRCNREFVCECVGVTSESVCQDERRTVRETMVRVTFEAVGDVAGGSRWISLEVLSDAKAERCLRVIEGQSRDRPNANSIISELARRRS